MSFGGLSLGGVVVIGFLLLLLCQNCTDMVLYQEGFEVDRLRPHFKNKKPKNGYSCCLRVKAGNACSQSQHINCIFSVKLRFSSVFVFLHFMVNLIKDERALQSCSTTITSLSVSSSAGNDVLPNDLLLWRRQNVWHSVFYSAKPKDYMSAFKVQRRMMYIYKSIYTTIPCVYIIYL